MKPETIKLIGETKRNLVDKLGFENEYTLLWKHGVKDTALLAACYAVGEYIFVQRTFDGDNLHKVVFEEMWPIDRAQDDRYSRPEKDRIAEAAALLIMILDSVIPAEDQKIPKKSIGGQNISTLALSNEEWNAKNIKELDQHKFPKRVHPVNPDAKYPIDTSLWGRIKSRYTPLNDLVSDFVIDQKQNMTTTLEKTLQGFGLIMYHSGQWWILKAFVPNDGGAHFAKNIHPHFICKSSPQYYSESKHIMGDGIDQVCVKCNQTLSFIHTMNCPGRFVTKIELALIRSRVVNFFDSAWHSAVPMDVKDEEKDNPDD